MAATGESRGAEIRRRNVAKATNIPSKSLPETCSTEHAEDKPLDTKRNLTYAYSLKPGTYWLTRIVLLRFLGFIYFVAFLVAYHQNKQLLGKSGLLPASNFLNNIKSRAGGFNVNTFLNVPSLLWFFDYEENLDTLLDNIAYAGLGLSTFLIIVGGANWPIMISLWVLYHSLVNIGQRWYSFGWESQLLESGFLAVFLCPVWNPMPVPRRTPTSLVAIWGYRWLIFRIMLGAGLIKIRGDKCWRQLTCMNYHYETQPVPNPVSYYLHQSPEIIHKAETLGNHFVELVVPFLLLLPRTFRNIGGFIQVVFQMILIISGNLSFLNWLTILPSIACFDDASLSWMFSKTSGSVRQRVWNIQRDEQVTKPHAGQYIRQVFNISIGILIAYLSIPVVMNLLSSRQAMNTSFDPFRLVNTYGAFGSITKERTEVIFQGTYDHPEAPDAKWFEYEFKCKPGNVTRTPCIISPYHYRLDWLMWFAAFQSYQNNPWLIHFAVKLLANDPDAISLIEHNPFEGKKPPKFIRAEHYRYVFTKIGDKKASSGAWWKRKRIGVFMPPVSLSNLEHFMTQMDFKMPRLPS